MAVGDWQGVGIRHPFTIGGEVYTWQDRPRGPHGFAFDAEEPGAPPAKWATLAGARALPHGVDQLGYLTERPQGDHPAVILCEGPADALTVRAWWPEAATVATQGVRKWDRRESAMLSRAGIRRVLVTLDNDDAARDGFDTLTERLRPWGIGARAVRMPVELNGEPTPKGADVTDWAAADGEAFPARFTAALRRALGRVSKPDEVSDLGAWAIHHPDAFDTWQRRASTSPPLLAPLLGDRREVAL